MSSLQQIIFQLQEYWGGQGCVIAQPMDGEVGAGTFHPATFLRAASKEPWRAAYVQPSRRPQDGRYGDNPNRLQRYYQFQVVMKPSPAGFQDLFLQSLAALGLRREDNDIRFVEDDWESPTLGAWGLGWEVWVNGMEVAQFTYFQEVGGMPVKPVMGEITYGLERLAMFLQDVDDVFALRWNDAGMTYGDLYAQNEREQSRFNFEHADTDWQMLLFDRYERECLRLLPDSFALAHKAEFDEFKAALEKENGRLADGDLPLPAYEMTMKCSHAFNLLDARGVISVTERAGYVARVRKLARLSARAYCAERERLGFPLLQKAEAA